MGACAGSSCRLLMLSVSRAVWGLLNRPHGRMDMSPLKIQVSVVSAKKRPTRWCQRMTPGWNGEREPLR